MILQSCDAMTIEAVGSFRARIARAPRREHGATLIELMIAMLVAAILIGMVFSVYTRLSVGYRAQAKVSDLQQALRAGKALVEREIRAAGHMMPSGVLVNGSMGTLSPIIIENDSVPGDTSFSPDKIRLYYADTAAMASVTGRPTDTSITVDDVDNFAIGELAIIVNQRTLVAESAELAPIASYDACLIWITNTIITPAATDDDTIEFGTTGVPLNSAGEPFNTATNLHCTDALDLTRSSLPMIYHFKARAYRLDPAPASRALGVLQVSPSGELLPNDWQIVGLGFTNLQFAARYYEDGDAIDRDGDGDPERDWYSGAVAPALTGVPFEVTMSLEVRTQHVLDLVPTSATPRFIDVTQPLDHNRIGDWDSVPLAGVADAARPEQYRGNHIYRWSTTTIDIRNIGVGR